MKSSYRSVYDHYGGKMMRISLSVGVIWSMASICLTILLVLVFLQDEWIGDTPVSKIPGKFGLWRWCADKDGVDTCRGDLSTFSSILSPAFRAATVFTGLSVVVTLLAILVWLTICCTSTLGLFKFSGVLQLLGGVFMLIVILSYPAGWDNANVISVCGPQADDFLLGTCDIRWTYMLAVVSCADSFLLGILALTLGYKQRITDHGDMQTIGPQQGYLINNMEISSEIAVKERTADMLMPGDSSYSQNNFLL